MKKIDKDLTRILVTLRLGLRLEMPITFQSLALFLRVTSAYMPVSQADSASQKSEQLSPPHSYAPERSDAQYTNQPTTTRLGTALDWLKSFVLPVLAAAYLALCYVAYKNTVPIAGRGLFDDSPKNIGMLIYNTAS